MDAITVTSDAASVAEAIHILATTMDAHRHDWAGWLILVAGPGVGVAAVWLTRIVLFAGSPVGRLLSGAVLKFWQARQLGKGAADAADKAAGGPDARR